MAYRWGVDSAQEVTKELYQCVLTNFGKPAYWGRYLTTVPDASEGLTAGEIKLLQDSGTKVMPIYNNFKEATGYRKGRVIAQNAAFHAKRLNFPKEKVLFANVERFFKVDEAWIRGYVDAMYNTDYKPGFYHDPVQGPFADAYCKAVSKDSKVANQSVLWSAEPEPGVTRAKKAPKFQPVKPSCKANVWGWQYGRSAKTCPIDTNLINDRLFELLW
ncbi:glycoside hydrolase domain-containing protein [Pontibacillus salicampi]|uniref:Glycoside hydrolase domain-containing protein n=1 Tax=Pontibacillus salicampi TaxID=1449801 RepID=A0ABV6LPC1_9BACI